MTLEELREACANAAANEAEHAEGADGIDTANRAADAIRAIPLPAPVNQGTPLPLFVTAQGEELARVTKERDEARAEVARLLNGEAGVRPPALVRMTAKRDALRAECDEARARLAELEATLTKRLDEATAERNEAVLKASEAERERDRLHKIFDDAGQGEHNVLALIDHYQHNSMETDALRRELVAAREVLARVQWGSSGWCPACGHHGELGHTTDCPIGAELAKRGGS